MLKYLLIFALTALLVSCKLDAPAEVATTDFDVDFLRIGIEHDDLLKLQSNKIKNYYVTMFLKTDSSEYKGRIRALGAGSRYLNKWGYKLELEDGLYNGLAEFNLSANTFDKTGILPLVGRDYFTHLGFDMYDIIPVAVSVNDGFASLYPLIERFEYPYFQRRNKPVAEIFKVGFNAKFTNVNNAYTENYFSKEYPDDDSYTTLIHFFEYLDHSDENEILEKASKYIDIENFLKFHIAMTILANPDAQRNNIIMYTETFGGPIKFMPWDFDNLLNNTSSFSYYAHNEIIAALLKNKEIRKMYADEFRKQLEDCANLISEYFDRHKEVVRNVHEQDPHLGEIYDLDSRIKKYKDFITKRCEYLDAGYSAFFDKDFYNNGL